MVVGSSTSSASDPVYEYFNPSKELIEGKEADILVLNLPGFKKEQVKVAKTSTKQFKISGKRLVTCKKWSHFLTYIPISSEYDFLAVSAKFGSEKLYFKLPKLAVPREALPKEESPQPIPKEETPKPPMYEDFDPSRKWTTHENEGDMLILDLPEFKKVELQVKASLAKMLLWISGVRGVSDNVWRRFHIEVPIPSDCDATIISAKFEKGKLYIKHPNLNASSELTTSGAPKLNTTPLQNVLPPPQEEAPKVKIDSKLAQSKEEPIIAEAPASNIPTQQNPIPPPQEEALKKPSTETDSKCPQRKEEPIISEAPMSNNPPQQNLVLPPQEAPKEALVKNDLKPPHHEEEPIISEVAMSNIPPQQNFVLPPQEDPKRPLSVITDSKPPQHEGTKPLEEPFGAHDEPIISEAPTSNIPPQKNPVPPPQKPSAKTDLKPPYRKEEPIISEVSKSNIPPQQNLVPHPQEEATKGTSVMTDSKPPQREGTKPPEQTFGAQEMPSSSSKSSSAARRKYDVFLSFRGADTRISFISHLANALFRSQIDTFIDYRLEKGEDISPTLLKTIEECCIALIIFSKDYADSEWCLDELAKIVECKNKIGQIVLPVFYMIDPTDAQEISGSFGKAFQKHREVDKQNPDKVNKWRDAVVETSNLNGWDSRRFNSESKLIDEIVNDILEKLTHMSSSDFDEEGLVGIDARIQDIQSSLSFGRSKDVLFLGILGMGGAGKTTIAATMYRRKLSKFEGHYFLPNVREQSEKRTLSDLQEELLYKILGQKDLNSGGTPNLRSIVINRLQRKKVIIVLDDVTTLQQIEVLVGKHTQYGPGSRIIITSRDSRVLNGCDKIYDVKSMTYCEAVQLFKLHAFRKGQPTKEHLKLTKEAISYAQGSPLALKVLGSNLYGKPIKEWESQLAKLSTIPINEVDRILRISFDGLDDYERKIFLDIACCFKGWNKDIAERILDGCGFSAIIGIRSLIEKSLIHVEGNKLAMHDLLQQMGRNVVYESCGRRFEKCSRLWDHKHICPLLERERASAAVEVISLDISEIDKDELAISPRAFVRMHHLRLLILQNSVSGKSKICLPQGLESLSDELRLLHWDEYPLKFLPSNFRPENLVELRLCRSQVEKLWDGRIVILKHLKCIDLKHSINLVEIPEFSQVPNLEDLYLQGCINLREIPSSIRYNKKLVHVALDNCTSLKTLPKFAHLTTLEDLSLHGCRKITDFPRMARTIKRLSLHETKIEQMPSFIRHLTQLEILDLGFCRGLESLPSEIGALKSLKCLLLTECSKLMSVSKNICNLKSLEDLNLGGCIKVDRLPENLGDLESLSSLLITGTGIRTLPSSINNLSKLKVLSCGGCEGLLLPVFTGLSSLEMLYLNDCGFSEFPDGICHLRSLKLLDLGGNNFEVLPECIQHLSELRFLCLRKCERLGHLPMITSTLKYLDARNCTSFRSIEIEEKFIFTQFSNFGNCLNLDKDILRILSTFTLFMMVSASSYFQESNIDIGEFDDENETDKKRVQWGASFCAPGNEIYPKACSFQNTGSSLIVNDLGVEGERLKGCCFWVVVDCNGLYDSHGVDVICDGHLTSDSADSADRFDFHSTFLSNRTPLIEDAAPIFLQSEHLFSWFCLFFGSTLSSFTRGEFKFNLMDGNKNSSPCRVIKCGITLLCATSNNQLFAPPHHFEGNVIIPRIQDAARKAVREEGRKN